MLILLLLIVGLCNDEYANVSILCLVYKQSSPLLCAGFYQMFSSLRFKMIDKLAKMFRHFVMYGWMYPSYSFFLCRTTMAGCRGHEYNTIINAMLMLTTHPV